MFSRHCFVNYTFIFNYHFPARASNEWMVFMPYDTFIYKLIFKKTHVNTVLLVYFLFYLYVFPKSQHEEG